MQGLNVHYIRTGRKTGSQTISPTEVLARQKFVQMRRTNRHVTPREAYDAVAKPLSVPGTSVPGPVHRVNIPLPRQKQEEREFVIDTTTGRLVDAATAAPPDDLIWRPVAAVRSDEEGIHNVDPLSVPLSDTDVFA